MEVIFTNHAKAKFEALRRHGFLLTWKQVRDAVKNPDAIRRGKGRRIIAQKTLDERYVLRVIYEKVNELVRIITFYPARRERYEG